MRPFSPKQSGNYTKRLKSGFVKNHFFFFFFRHVCLVGLSVVIVCACIRRSGQIAVAGTTIEKNEKEENVSVLDYNVVNYLIIFEKCSENGSTDSMCIWVKMTVPGRSS